MKFRGVITESVAMKDFMNITTSFSKFSKDCVMRITSRKLYLIVSDEEGGPRTPLVWCELPSSFYFKEYNLVGVSEDYNEIYLELSTALLAKTASLLRQEVKFLKIKLTNKELPCLTFEMELVSGEISTKQCVHDIPVEVISRKHWDDYQEPKFNDFHVSIEMPHLKTLKSIVDRMKNMSHSLIVSATKNGKLTLEIKTNAVKMCAHFSNLGVESFAVADLPTVRNNDSDDEELQSVNSVIDIKKFLMFLTGMQLANCKTSLSIVQDKMVKLFMEEAGAMTLQIFLTQLSI